MSSQDRYDQMQDAIYSLHVANLNYCIVIEKKKLLYPIYLLLCSIIGRYGQNLG